MPIWERSLEGELTIDNRGSGGKLYETATRTCSNCHRVVVLNPDRSRPRKACYKCGGYCCDYCDERVCNNLSHTFDEIRNQLIRKGIT